jgi:hypothetical protein
MTDPLALDLWQPMRPPPTDRPTMALPRGGCLLIASTSQSLATTCLRQAAARSVEREPGAVREA